MKSLSEWNETTSAYELFTFLHWKIMDGEIRTFSDLAAFTAGIPESNRKAFALKNCFQLIRKLYWGFFRDLTREGYGCLWENLTIRNGSLGFGADLKRNMTITNVFIGFLDIHGYTAFCEKAGRNTSLLRALDESIESDIRSLCRNFGVLCNRLRGDEIILAGATALDIVRSVVGIAEYFSRKRNFSNNGAGKGRSGSSIILPELKISAGIAGGRKYTPLIITETGDLSGSVVNASARLQSFANRLSGSSTRVVMSQYVHIRYLNELKAARDPQSWEPALLFVKVGTIAMKGLRVPLVEALIDPGEQYRARYQDVLQTFRKSLRSGLWPSQVFLDLGVLLRWMVQFMPPFSLKEETVPESGRGERGPRMITNKVAAECIDAAMTLFRSGQDFEAAVGMLHTVVSCLEKVPSIDQIVMRYARAATDKYLIILGEYRRELNQLSDAGEVSVFTPSEIGAIVQLRSQVSAYQELRNRLQSRIQADRKKQLWQQGVATSREKLDVRLYFGK